MTNDAVIILIVFYRTKKTAIILGNIVNTVSKTTEGCENVNMTFPLLGNSWYQCSILRVETVNCFIVACLPEM